MGIDINIISLSPIKVQLLPEDQKWGVKWRPSWISRWQSDIEIFWWQHWIAGTLKPGYRHQNVVCMCVSEVTFQPKIWSHSFPVTAILKFWISKFPQEWELHTHLDLFHIGLLVPSNMGIDVNIIFLSLIELKLLPEDRKSEKMVVTLDFNIVEWHRIFLTTPLDSWSLKTWV